MDELIRIERIGVREAVEIAGSPNDPHVHPFEELIVGMEGSLEHFIDFRAASIQAPYVSFISKGKVHRVKPAITDGKCSIWVIRFMTEFIPETAFQLYANYHEHANIALKSDESFKSMVSLCGIMYEEMQKENPCLPVVRDLLKALFNMIDAVRQSDEELNQAFPVTQNTTFRNFLKILEENFRRPEGVEFYAEKLFMSARNLNIICQNIMQRSATELIEMRKLTEAKNLLIYTDKSISEIGFELGFNEKAYFSKVFRKKSGNTPTEFRDEMRRLIS